MPEDKPYLGEAQSSEQEAEVTPVGGELEGSLQQTPWRRGAGGVLKPQFSPTTMNEFC